MSKNAVVSTGRDSELYEALSILKNLGAKKPVDNTYRLARELLVIVHGPYNLEEGNDQLSDFVECPQTMEKMLSQILDSLKNLLLPAETQQLSVPGNSVSLKTYIKSLKNKIDELEHKLQTNDKNYKTTHLKLLNNVKKLNQQLHERESQLHLLNQRILQKEDEIESLGKMNEKKYKKIKRLESEISQLQQHLTSKQQQLDVQKKCSALLETTVNKIVDEPFNMSSAPEVAVAETGIQVKQQEETINDKVSESSAMTESKQSKYLQSIERLTSQLSQAYARINDLTSSERQRKGSIKTKTKSTHFGMAKK